MINAAELRYRVADKINAGGVHREIESPQITGETGQTMASGCQFKTKIGAAVTCALMLFVEHETDGVVAEIDAIAEQINNCLVGPRDESFGFQILRCRLARDAACQCQCQKAEDGTSQC